MSALAMTEQSRWTTLSEFLEPVLSTGGHPVMTMRSALGSSALHFAALGGNVVTASLLLRQGLSPNETNYYGETPLHWACQHGFIPMILLLLAGGADVNSIDYDGESPLHWACHDDDLNETVRLLLQSGAKRNVRNLDLLTPLQLAIQENSLKNIQTLTSRRSLLLRRLFYTI